MSIKKFDFKNKKPHDSSEFAITLVASVITGFLFIVEKIVLFKFILFAITVFLSIIAIQEFFQMLELKQTEVAFKDVRFLRWNFIQLKIKLSVWSIGVLIVLYSLFLMIFYNEFAYYLPLIQSSPIISFVLLAIGFLLFLAGLLSRAVKEAGIELEGGLEPIKWLRYLEEIGILVIFAGFSILSYSFIHLNPSVFIVIYFSGMVIGMALIMSHEIIERNITSVILLVIGIVLLIIQFNLNIFPVFKASFLTDLSLMYAHPIQIVDAVQRTALIIFFISALSFLFLKEQFKEDSKVKEYMKDAIIITFFIWIIALSQMILFSMF